MPMKKLILFLILAFPLTSQAASSRVEIDLRGTWQFQNVEELTTPPQSGDWNATEVPSTHKGFDYERMWLKRTFRVPATMKGQRIKIEFDGVKYNSRIFVNGQHVGGCLNGYDAFTVDVTDAVKVGEDNVLAVGCHDWTGVFTSEGDRVDFSKKPDWQRPRRFVQDKVIAPIGGYYDSYGIWGDVRLVSRPEVYVSDLFIKPSVRKKELVVDYKITNESKTDVIIDLNSIVEDQNQDLKSLSLKGISVASGKTISKTVVLPWSDARYWSHEDPYLYHLRTELSSGDESRQRFGFKEFWIEGHRYILNGKNINLLATSWWPPTEPIERPEIEKRWKAIKKAGIVCFRTHTQTWRRVHYDVADELGLLMIIEGAMWHDPYCTAYHDPTYWKNYDDMIHSMIDREKNRASVIMWSMENESYSGKEKTEQALKYLPASGLKAKQWDPTRPIYFESDGDPGGVADAVGLHYVHEYPQYTCWPNEAYWLDEPFTANSWYIESKEKFVWKKEKPFYMGEFLWAPAGTPAPHSIFYGDEAYRDLDLYTLKAKAEVWKMQILAFRHQEAGGMSPWTVGYEDLTENNPLYRAHQYAYQHQAAYCLDYDSRFFSGETVERRVSFFNDTMKDSKLKFKWTLSDGDTVVRRGEDYLSMEAGERLARKVTLSFPTVEKRTELTWKLLLKQNGKQVFEDNHTYYAFPKTSLPQLKNKVGLFNPNKSEIENHFKQSNLNFEAVKSLDSIRTDVDVLVIAPNAFSDSKKSAPTLVGRVDPQRGAIREFLARGGRILVLRQDAYPTGLFDVGLTSQKSTMTFPLRSSHPALNNVKPEDLKFWRGNNLVARTELSRPGTGSAVSIIASGSKTGLANVPLLERKLEKGTVVHSQLLLTEKLDSEPTARAILSNLLEYLDSWKGEARTTALLGGDQNYREKLRGSLQLNFEEFDKEKALDQYSLIILNGKFDIDEKTAQKIIQYVESGGNLLVHRPDAASMKKLTGFLGVDLEMQNLSGVVSKSDIEEPFLESITREDLYWTVKIPGVSWTRQPMSKEMIDGIVGRKFESKGLKRYEVEDWKTEGGYIKNLGDRVLFATVGTASQEIDFPESGLYALGVTASGTPCRGEYPTVQISINGEMFGIANLEDGQVRDYGVVGYVKKGRHKVTVAFINDGDDKAKGEDRNLEIDAVLIGQVPKTEASVTFLTVPSAIALVKKGKGRIVFDRVRWDSEKENGQKAARYACSILTELGADFTPPPSVTIETEQMIPNEGIPYYNVSGGITYMGSNGYITTKINVAETKTYKMELLASGESSEDIYPLVHVHIDGKKVAEVQLTTGVWRRYPLELKLEKGEHEFKLQFMNDHWAPSGDRNLELDKVIIYNSKTTTQP